MGVTLSAGLNLMKRQGQTFADCLSVCSADVDCKGTSFDASTATCTFYSCVDLGSEREDLGVTFALFESSVVDARAGVACGADAIPSLSLPVTTGNAIGGLPGSSVVGGNPVITGAAGAAAGGQLTTSVFTVTACPSTVLNCPASEKLTYLTTATFANNGAAATGLVTSTLYSTSVQTIIGCPPTVTDCPARDRVTSLTSVVVAYTTVCPASAAATGAIASGSSNGMPGTGSGSNSNSAVTVVGQNAVNTVPMPSSGSNVPVVSVIIYSSSGKLYTTTTTCPAASTVIPVTNGNVAVGGSTGVATAVVTVPQASGSQVPGAQAPGSQGSGSSPSAGAPGAGAPNAGPGTNGYVAINSNAGSSGSCATCSTKTSSSASGTSSPSLAVFTGAATKPGMFVGGMAVVCGIFGAFMGM